MVAQRADRATKEIVVSFIVESESKNTHYVFSVCISTSVTHVVHCTGQKMAEGKFFVHMCPKVFRFV